MLLSDNGATTSGAVNNIPKNKTIAQKVDDELKKARDKMTKSVQQAEAQKANLIRPPPGELDSIIHTGQRKELLSQKVSKHVEVGTGSQNSDSDDDDFQIGYYLDDVVKLKIKQGKFVDLAKLIPKDRTTIPHDDENDNFKVITREGYLFFVQKEKEQLEINSFRWRSAFKEYAGLYLMENPHRAAEVHQYISEIESASLTYLWENVYGYDIMFRHRMEKKPHKLWSKTHQKGWNIFMRDRKGTINMYHSQGLGLRL